MIIVALIIAAITSTVGFILLGLPPVIIVALIIAAIALTVGFILLGLPPVIIVALIIAVIALGASIIIRKGLINVKIDNSGNPDYDFVEENYEVSSSGISQIEYNDKNSKIDIATSDDDKIHLHYWNSANKKYNIENKDGKLIITGHDNNLGLRSNHAFKILLPASRANHIGMIINSHNGALNVDKINAGSLIIKIHNGKITLNDVTLAENITIDSHNGAITLNGAQLAGTLKINSHNGKIYLANVHASSDIHIEGHNGKFDAENCSSKTNCRIKLRNSKVSASKIAVGGKLSIGTNNGIVTGSVIGRNDEFGAPRIITSAGVWNGPEKSLEVKCKNGIVRFEFKA